MNIVDLYEKKTDEREVFLNRAQRLASVARPTLDPKHEGEDPITYSDLGSNAVNRLAATLLSVLFPAEVKWFRLQVPELLKSKYGFQITNTHEAQIAAIEDRVNRFLTSINFKGVTGELMTRLLVEGNVLLIIESNVARLIPLGDFVIQRKASKPLWLVFKEQDPDATAADYADDEVQELYTYVDFANNEVYQQYEDEEDATLVTDIDASQFLPIVASFPVTANYVDGYAYSYYGTLYQANELSRDLMVASRVAADNKQYMVPDCGITPKELASKGPGSIVVVNDFTKKPQWNPSGSKVNDWIWITNHLEVLRSTLDEAFAIGLSVRAREVKTATEVEQIASELDSVIQFAGQILSESLQAPVVNAALNILGLTMTLGEFLQDEEGNLPEDLPDEVEDDLETEILEPSIIAGTLMLTRETMIQRLLQAIQLMAMIDASFPQQVNTIALFNTLTSALSIDTSGIITPGGDIFHDMKQLVSLLPEDQAKQLITLLEQSLQQILQQNPEMAQAIEQQQMSRSEQPALVRQPSSPLTEQAGQKTRFDY